MIRRPPRSTPLYSSAASDVYKRQEYGQYFRTGIRPHDRRHAGRIGRSACVGRLGDAAAGVSDVATATAPTNKTALDCNQHRASDSRPADPDPFRALHRAAGRIDHRRRSAERRSVWDSHRVALRRPAGRHRCRARLGGFQSAASRLNDARLEIYAAATHP